MLFVIFSHENTQSTKCKLFHLTFDTWMKSISEMCFSEICFLKHASSHFLDYVLLTYLSWQVIHIYIYIYRIYSDSNCGISDVWSDGQCVPLLDFMTTLSKFQLAYISGMWHDMLPVARHSLLRMRGSLVPDASDSVLGSEQNRV